MAQSFEGVLANIPGLGGYLAKQRFNEQAAAAEMQQGAGAIGILSHIQQQQQAMQLRDALAKGDTAALMRTPGGVDILGKLAQQQNAGITGQLHSAQLQEILRNGEVKRGELAARNALAGLMTPAGSFGQSNVGVPDTPQPDSNARVFNTDAEAIRAMQEAEAKGVPFTGNVPNPANVKALAIASGSSLPRSAQAAILNPGVAGNGQTIAPRVIQDPKSPTGWGYMNPRDNSITPGAPAPASESKAAATAANAGMAGVGMLDPETLKFKAQQILAGDRQAGLGYAKSAPMKAALDNAVMQEAKAQGITGKELAGIMSEYEGAKAGQRTLGERQAKIELAATVAEKFAPLAVSASEAFDRTPFKSLNDIQKAIQGGTSSPELRKFNAANMSLINAYARAVSPSGVPAQAEKDHAREVLDTGFSKGDYKAAVEQLQVEIAAELEAPGAVKAGMKKFFNGKEPVSTGSVTAPVREFATEADAIKSGVKGQVKINGRNARID